MWHLNWSIFVDFDLFFWLERELILRNRIFKENKHLNKKEIKS